VVLAPGGEGVTLPTLERFGLFRYGRTLIMVNCPPG